MGISERGGLVFFLLANPMEAARVMKGEKWTKEKEDKPFVLHIQVLQRAPVPPSGRNPCGNIPRQGNGRCTLQAMNVAGGRFVHVPPAIPDSTRLLKLKLFMVHKGGTFEAFIRSSKN